jgi:ribosomal protein S21
MGAKVTVRHNEAARAALRRLKKLMEREQVAVRSTERRGTFRWQYETKEHFQKPSLLKRIKKARKRSRARKASKQAKGPAGTPP